MEGQNVVFEYRYAEGRADRLPALAAELVRLKVDIIVVESNVAALAAKRATQTVPIVMGIVGDPVKAGVVGNLGRPGGNVTGLTLIHPELSGKRDYLPDTEAAARSIGLKIHAIGVRSPMELDAAFKAVADVRPSAFFTLPGGLFLENRARILEFATKNRLPGVFPSRAYAEAGGLMSYGPNLTTTFERAAVFVDRILKGAKPADLPIEQPTKFELVINLRTARALGLTIPPVIVATADGVIE